MYTITFSHIPASTKSVGAIIKCTTDSGEDPNIFCVIDSSTAKSATNDVTNFINVASIVDMKTYNTTSSSIEIYRTDTVTLYMENSNDILNILQLIKEDILVFLDYKSLLDVTLGADYDVTLTDTNNTDEDIQFTFAEDI